MIDDVKKSGKTTVMIEPSLILRKHEQTAFADENGSEILCLVDVVRCAVGFELVDADLTGFVEIPAGLCPQRFDMTFVTTSRAVAEKLVPAGGAHRIKIDSGLGHGRRNGELEDVKGRELLRDTVIVKRRAYKFFLGNVFRPGRLIFCVIF